MSTTDKDVKLEELRKLVSTTTPIPDEPDFLSSDETLLRYLKACEWDVADAERHLAATAEYRRSTRPLQSHCPWCQRRPGFHSMRQVGFDELGRPVLYSSFAQATTHKNKVEDAVQHVIYLIENAKMTMKPGISTWVFVIDCSGMSIPACNPKLGYGVAQIMATHYPERLGMIICINHNPVFQGIWKAMKVFLHPNTISKMRLMRSKDKIQQTFQKYFPEELSKWLLEEINLNKRHPLSETQRTFWAKPESAAVHDPRGTPSYVREFVDTYLESDSRDTSNSGPRLRHKPHTNIIDSIRGTLQHISLSPEELSEREAARALAGESSAQPNDDSDRAGSEMDSSEINIDDALRIPPGAVPLNT